VPQRKPNFEATGQQTMPDAAAPPAPDPAAAPVATVPVPAAPVSAVPVGAGEDRLRSGARPPELTPPARPRAEPLPEPSAATARRRMSLPPQPRIRRPPSEHEQARRRTLLLWTKWLLPAAALLLLGSIAAWPELNRSLNAGRTAYHQVAGVNLDTAMMLGARYHGLDAHGRPYMITADEARQVGPDRIDLVRPIADSLTQSGSWVLVHAASGVYMPHSQILDLFGHVTLYRDDGTLVDGPTAVMDVKRGVVVSDDWVHVEGPFGVLDAQGDLISQREGVAQFRGPGRMILNDDHAAAAARGGADAARGPAGPHSAGPDSAGPDSGRSAAR